MALVAFDFVLALSRLGREMLLFSVLYLTRATSFLWFWTSKELDHINTSVSKVNKTERPSTLPSVCLTKFRISFEQHLILSEAFEDASQRPGQICSRSIEVETYRPQVSQSNAVSQLGQDRELFDINKQPENLRGEVEEKKDPLSSCTVEIFQCWSTSMTFWEEKGERAAENGS